MDKYNNISIRCSDKQLIGFFYPSYVYRREIGLDDAYNDVVYVGAFYEGLEDDLQMGCRSYINLSAVRPDYDLELSKRENILDFVYGKHNKKTPKRVLGDSDEGIPSLYSNLSDSEFIQCIKHIWVTGVFPYEDDEVSLYELYKALRQGGGQFMRTLMEVRKDYDDWLILCRLVAVLVKAYNVDSLRSQSSISKGYLELLSGIERRYTHEGIRAILIALSKADIERDVLLSYLVAMLTR